MSNLGSIIKGIASTCKISSNKFFNNENISSNFVTREEYNILKSLVLEMKTEVENIKNKGDGKNN